MHCIKMIVLGDAHIPDRATDIPSRIAELIESEKPFDVVVYTGDLTGREVLEYVKTLGKEVHVVQGNMDWLPLPEYDVFELFGIRFGVIHGDQVRPRGDIPKLTRIAKELDVRVLISGHTHSPFISVHSGIIHLNPGSVTGVPSGTGGSLIPSLMIVYVCDDRSLDIRLYELIGERLTMKRERINVVV